VALLIPNFGIVDAQHSHMRTTVLRDWVLLLKLAVYRRMLVIAALVEGSHALNDTFAVIHWRTSGVNLPIISLLWSESVLSEVVVFLLIGPRLIRRIAPSGACALAAGAGVVRWSVLACTTSPFLLGLAQPLHGFTFALLHLACMRIIVVAVPIRLAATAQSIYNTVCIGLVTAMLTLVSGVLYDQLGGLAFLTMAALCLLALPISLGLPEQRLG
jgi:PPP family 3-phenylpropionic acid transporter